MADLASEPTELANEPNLTTTDDHEVVDEDAPLANAVAGAVTIASGDPPSQDLLGELARAMHAAATSQYERMNAELERRRADQVEAIASRSTSEVERLKAASEADVEAIDAWAKAETEKIRLERIRRIDARGEQLQAQLARQDTIREREVFAVEAAIDAHRSEIDLFFGRMEREHDPAAIAKVASTMPGLPPLAQIADDARRAASAEFAELEAELETSMTSLPATPLADPEVAVTESRLMAVMDPEATQNHADPSREWAEPNVVSVAAGTPPPQAADEDGPSRMGSTLLRTVRAIRPLSEHKDRGES